MIEVHNLFSIPLLKTQLDFPVDEIEKLCYQFKNDNDGVVKSNEGGWQSGNILYPESPFSFLYGIEDICNHFARDVLAFDRIISLTSAWININHKHHSNRTHTHPLCTLSGVYYVKTPEESGDIIFYHPCEDMMSRDWCNTNVLEYNCYNSNTMRYPVSQGQLLLFPSFIHHRVDPNKSDEGRISISFNMSEKF